MEDKESASFGDQCRSASCGFQRSNAGGEIKRRMRKFVAPRCRQALRNADTLLGLMSTCFLLR
ncbi:hypothetical protein PIB30_048278 [Stylosanthes scabra]|uniref:Uncharacterized protein n=1 Tax=Stylosanthes scabra TaxID=79078 RepID=A0ABU6TGQ5_9FABA|nr:hypothetical protein [Stylosanthes scabra]